MLSDTNEMVSRSRRADFIAYIALIATSARNYTHPHFDRARSELINLYEQLGRYDEAIREAQNLTGADPARVA